jgi:hypothetical protein
MNYGYDPTTNDAKLARDLAKIVARDEFIDARKQKPYVEVDQLYPGVRIRRITHLSDEKIDKLVAEADAVFTEHIKTYPLTGEPSNPDGL